MTATRRQPRQQQQQRRREVEPEALCATCASAEGVVLVDGRLLCRGCDAGGAEMAAADGRAVRLDGLDRLTDRLAAENDARDLQRRRGGRDDYRVRDRLGRLEPRNPFCDPLVLLRAAPDLGRAFAKVVPDEYLTARGEDLDVRCVCGGETALPSAQIAECVGACGRWFVRTAAGVRCALPDDREAA